MGTRGLVVAVLLALPGLAMPPGLTVVGEGALLLALVLTARLFRATV